MSLDTSRFHALADKLLQHIVDKVEDELGDDFDADLNSGIATLEDGAGRQFLINKHESNQQIWLSSPKSGATHFIYDQDAGLWRSTRDASIGLLALLSTELGIDL